jgi:sec-independent protein translocase protein TatB
VFGLSFSEVVVVAIVALVAVGPQKLPGLLRTLGGWARKLRVMTHEMRAQSGIDDVLRSEGLHGGLTELRSLMRGQHLTSPIYTPPPYNPPPAPAATTPGSTADATAAAAPPPPPDPVEEDPYANLDVDDSREYPPEGADAYGAIPDDLIDGAYPEPEVAPAAAEPAEPASPAAEAATNGDTPLETGEPAPEAAPANDSPKDSPEPAAVPAALVTEPAAPPAPTTSHER